MCIFPCTVKISCVSGITGLKYIEINSKEKLLNISCLIRNTVSLITENQKTVGILCNMVYYYYRVLANCLKPGFIVFSDMNSSWKLKLWLRLIDQ